MANDHILRGTRSQRESLNEKSPDLLSRTGAWEVLELIPYSPEASAAGTSSPSAPASGSSTTGAGSSTVISNSEFL